MVQTQVTECHPELVEGFATETEMLTEELPQPLSEGPSPVDIVYILGTGSQWQDNELRYSLRSVHQHLTNYRNIWIVGEWPEWLNKNAPGIYHIPASDNSKWQRHLNMEVKILLACHEDTISNDFLFMNDDHFFTADTSAADYPFYHCGELSDKIASLGPCDTYAVSLRNTMNILYANGCSTKNFDAHCPILYHKYSFINAMEQYDWGVNYGYVIKSLYANTFGIGGTYMEDLKIKNSLTTAQFVSKLQGRHVFSIGDAALNSEIKKWFAARYPVPSPWENI